MGKEDLKREREKGIPPCNILVDEEGYWYYEGHSQIREDFVRMFYEHLELLEDGSYIIRIDGDICALTVKDTAFVVWGVDKTDSKILLSLSDWTQEELDPDMLWIGENNVLYCTVKEGRYPCRFSRKAYYQIAQWIEEEEGKYLLKVGLMAYPLRREIPSGLKRD